MSSNNYYNYDKSQQNNMNSHIIQGSLFNNYTNEYNSVVKNKEGFVHKLTSGFGSIIEAMESIDSVQKVNNDLKRTTIVTDHENEMNKLTSEYATMYNSYMENSESLSEEERKEIEKDLLYKKDRLTLLSENIRNEMNALLQNNTEGFQGFDSAALSIPDEITTRGKLETTKLRMTSNYYFYLVYFIVAITLISFTFNILVNPNADEMSALFVAGGIVVVFLISKIVY